MRKMPLMAAVVFILYVNSAFGQTASDIDKKYGEPTKAYSVSEHIWMTPEYAADGQVCRMRLYPKRVAPGNNYYYDKLPFAELRGVLYLLAPLHIRGEQREPFGGGVTGGGIIWTTYTYEKVTFIFNSSFQVNPDDWKNLKRDEFKFSIEDMSTDGKPEKKVKYDDDFPSRQELSAEIVTIRWTDRKCS